MCRESSIWNMAPTRNTSCHVSIQKWNGLDVVDQDDTPSSALLSYVILVKRLGVLMDCIRIWWAESPSLMVSVLVTIKIHPICRHLWCPRRGNNMQVLRQRNAEYIGVKVAMAILPLASKSPWRRQVELRYVCVIDRIILPYLIMFCCIVLYLTSVFFVSPLLSKVEQYRTSWFILRIPEV